MAGRKRSWLLEPLLQTSAIGVDLVLALSNPLQIPQSVVCFISIYMVDAGLAFGVGNKRFRQKAVQ